MNTLDSLLTERPNSLTPAQNTQGDSYANSSSPSLRDTVEQAVTGYFKHLEGQDVTDVYEMVLAEVEIPLLEVVMKYTRHNQTKAAQVLGLNRGTLRKKLKQYGLL